LEDDLAAIDVFENDFDIFYLDDLLISTTLLNA
jgi:hypothetical protein